MLYTPRDRSGCPLTCSFLGSHLTEIKALVCKERWTRIFSIVCSGQKKREQGEWHKRWMVNKLWSHHHTDTKTMGPPIGLKETCTKHYRVRKAKRRATKGACASERPWAPQSVGFCFSENVSGSDAHSHGVLRPCWSKSTTLVSKGLTHFPGTSEHLLIEFH